MTPNTPATNPQTDLAVAAARADDRREIERLRAELVAVRDQAARETTFRALAEMRLERAEGDVERLQAERHEWRRAYVGIVKRVRAVHVPDEYGDCWADCDPHPCPTIRALDPQTPTSGPESPADGLAGSNACSDTPEGGEGL